VFLECGARRLIVFMALSSFTVVTNALRLNATKL